MSDSSSDNPLTNGVISESIKLGLMPPLTGVVGMYGQEITRAAQIACAEINESGGVLGRPLELIVEDDGSLPDSSVAAAKRLVDQHHCVAIIGNLLSNSRISVAYQVAEPRKVPYLNFSFYEGSILSRYFFHFAALPNQQIDKMIPYMRANYGPRIFFAGNNYEWPRGSIAAGKTALEAVNGTVVGEEYTDLGVEPAVIEKLLEKVDKESPDVFIPYFAGSDQINLLTGFTEMGMKSRIAVVMGHYDELMASKLPPEVREGFYSSNTYFMGIDTEENRNFLSRLNAFEGVSGIWPDGDGILTNFGEGTYLCVKAFATAANRAGSLDAEALVESLKTVTVAAPQGRVEMEAGSHHAKVNTYLSRCKRNGEFEIIERFGVIPPSIPERYKHQSIPAKETREDEVRLQARIIEQLSEAVMLVDLGNEAILYSNSGANSLLGAGTDISARNLDDFVDEKQRRALVTELKSHGRWKGNLAVHSLQGLDHYCYCDFSSFTHPSYGEVWLGVLNDISGRKKAEHALLESEERLRRVIEITNDGVWDWNLLTHEDYLSTRWKEILGYEDHELENQDSTFFDNIHPDDKHRVEAALKRHLENHEPYQIEVRMRHKNGDYRWVLSRGQAIFDGQGQPVRMVGVITDIHDNRIREEELNQYRDELEGLVNERTQSLQEALSTKDQFLSRVSHELRTPLNAIMGFSQIMGYESSDASVVEGANEIHRAGDHLLELINELLDIARIESGKMNIVVQSTAVRTVLDQAARLLESDIKARNLTFNIECAPELFVLCDSSRLRQVLINLLSNAAKYNQPHGFIKVACQVMPDDKLRILVSDSGQGISADMVQRVFEPFDRLGVEYSGEQGTGIGLTLSRQLCELMGGQIGFESKEEVGSAFWVELPMGEQSSAAAAEEAKEYDAVPGKAKILYIEDSDSNMRVVKAMLRQFPDCQLLPAVNGEQGLEIARDILPDIILLDINLPVMNGYEVLKELRSDEATWHIPVIAVSADAMPLDIEKGYKAGFLHYLSKPVDMKELFSVLDKELGSKSPRL